MILKMENPELIKRDLEKINNFENEVGCPLEFVIEQLKKGFLLAFVKDEWFFFKLIADDENEELLIAKTFKTKDVYDFTLLANETIDENGKPKFKDTACMTFSKRKEG